MNKKISILLFILIVLATSFIIGYKYFLPGYLADVIMQDSIPQFIPDSYKEKVKNIHEPLNKYNKQILEVADSLDLSLDQVLQIIESIDPNEVLKVYHLLENKNIEDSDEVFSLIEQNITIKDVNIKSYQQLFNKYATPARINRGLRYAEKHELIASLAPETAKKIAKKIALKYYSKENISREDMKILKVQDP